MKTKDLSVKQIIIGAANAQRKDSFYIVSKIEKGQQKIFKCLMCKKKFDLSDSEEYGAAVSMFNRRKGLCAGCYYKKTVELLY